METINQDTYKQDEPTNEQNELEWLKQEQKRMEENAYSGETLPSLKLEENKIVEFEIDFSEPFNSWTSPEGALKKIIPVTHQGERKNFWLNVKNPVYKDIVDLGAKGQTQFKIMRTGSQKDTKYNLVKG